MPYEDIPQENAPALPVRADEYTFHFSFEADAEYPNGRATIDDLDMFSPENNTTNKQMLDFLDRVVTDVIVRGQSTGPKVRGKGIPYACLMQLMQGVGETMKQYQNAGN